MAALAKMEQGQVIEALGGIGMVGPQCPLADCQRALAERLRLAVATMCCIKAGKVVECCADRGVVTTMETLNERQRTLGAWNSFGVFAGAVELLDLTIECGKLVARLRGRGACRQQFGNQKQRE